MTECYYVETESRSIPGAWRAINLATKLAREAGSDVLILSPAKKDVPGSTLGRALGDRAKDLLAGKPFKVYGIAVRYASTATFEPLAEQGVVVAFWPGSPMFAKLGRMDDCRALIVVPGVPSFCAEWKARHKPTLVRVGIETPGPDPKRPTV